jgi:hypothetical protein
MACGFATAKLTGAGRLRPHTRLAVVWFLIAPGVDRTLSYKAFYRELALKVGPETGLYAYDWDETALSVVPFCTGRRIVPINRREELAALAREASGKVAVITVDVRSKNWHFADVGALFPNLLITMPEGRVHCMRLFSNVPLNPRAR